MLIDVRESDEVVEEVPIALVYNGQPHVVMLASPLDLEDFALGFSLTEGLVDSVFEVSSVRIHHRAEGIEVRMRISMVFQKPNPFPKSIYENVAWGARINGYKGDMDELVAACGERILDPFMGSGTTGAAAVAQPRLHARDLVARRARLVETTQARHVRRLLHELGTARLRNREPVAITGLIRAR